MLLSHWLHVRVLISLGVIVIAVGSAVVVSVVLARGTEPDAAVLEAAGRGDLVKKQDEQECSGGPSWPQRRPGFDIKSR